VKEKQSGFNLPIADGAPKLPLKIAADEALANFKEVNLGHITALDIPFSSVDGETSVKKRNEYITLDRIIRFGATPGCRACESASDHAQHSAKCRARFNGLIRADRIASSGVSTPPPTPVVPPTPTPAPVSPPPVAADAIEDEIDPASFSAGIVPGEEWKEALVGKINQHISSEFVQVDKDRNMQRRLHQLPGENMLFEYACSDDSLLGHGCQRFGVKCTRLTKQVVDLSDPEQVNQVLGQVQSMAGAELWLSITCTFHSPLQNLNIHQYGKSYEQKLKKKRKVVRRMVNLALLTGAE